jgi:hypothetical protein
MSAHSTDIRFGIRAVALCVTLGAMALLPSCASDGPIVAESRNSPEWIARSNRIGDEGSARVIYAVGEAEANRNRMLQMTQARNRARNNLARTVGSLVQSMVKEYIAANRDYYEDMDVSATEEYTQDISRLVADQMISVARQWDDYRDPIDRSQFVLYQVDLEDVILSYRDQMSAAFRREVMRKRIKASADAFERDLDTQLQKLGEMTAEQLDALVGGF